MDNASTDESATAITATFPGVTLLRLDENIGFAAANNIGIAMLDDCDLVALLNPDATADPEWLATLVAAAEAHPEMAGFASMIERAGDAGLLDSAGDVYHVYGTAWPGRHGAPTRTATVEEEVFGPSAAAALYHRSWLVRLGGFDESFFCYFEDVDLNLRLQVAGGRCLYVPCGPRPARRRREHRRPLGVHDLPLAAQPRLDVRQVGAATHLLALPADARPAQRGLDRVVRRRGSPEDAAAREA